jgi:ribonucleotide reductase alpha subunit
MKIKKRDGRLEQLSFDKIIYRLKKIKNDATLPNKENSNGKLSSIDTDLVAQKVILSIYDGVSSSELDEEAARIAISMTENPEYARLASRIIISNLHKNTSECFSDIMERLYSNVDKNGKPAPALADDFIQLIRDHKDILNETIDYKRDYLFDYFGFKTLEKSYLMKLNGKIVERPQHLYMRVAVQVHKNDIENVIKTYNLISQHYFTFASPTMFNSGSRLGNLSSCFLIGTHDSIEGIFKTMSDVAKISKVGGGIGIHINNIRSKGSVIRGTNGTSDGIIPMLKVYNSISTYVNQCFTPNTPVYTRYGIKRMDQVTTDDHLVTLDGSFKKVNEVIVNQKCEEILEIAVACGIEPLCCTKVHEIYALRSKSRTGKDRLLEQLRSGVKKASFMPADKLSSNDYVGFPIPTFEQDSDIWTLEKCKAYGTSLIGCAADTVFETAVLHLPKEKLAVVVAAMMDRCVKKQGGLLFTCESLNVIRSFRYMLLRFGILTSRGKKGNTSILKIPKIQALKDLGLFTRFEIPKPPKFKKATAPKTPNVINFFQFENILYCRIKSINKKMYTGDVYDFNMIDNHNYLTDMGLVHNSGKRKGSFAIYLSPEHPDILEFLDLRKNQGSEDLRARDLFYAMWMPDLFMEQVEKDGDWYLMDPDECPGLADAYGKEYAELYWKYVEEKRYKRQIKAQDIWMRILESQIETGNPYIVYKDQANLKSNQKNIGTIKSSNLCAEVLLHSDHQEYAVCFTGDTQILTKEGYRRIDECDNKEVLSYFNNDVDLHHKEQFVKATLIDNGVRDVYKMTCENGSVIKGTEDHLFMTVNHGWTKLKDLTSEHQLLTTATKSTTGMTTGMTPGTKSTSGTKSTKLKSIEYVGKERVYDLNVPETHNFIAEGFVVHNCNLMSISLQKFVKYDERKKPYFDHQLFFDVTKHAVLPMNNIIDYNYYPTPETRKSNLLHRPIGMGSQAISELFIKMRIPFESAEARKLNKEIFETYYFAALTGSMELAKRDGPYSTFKGSPLSEGKFQFDLWAEHNGIDLKDYLSGRWDWEALRKDIMAHGVRNSTLTTCMPTASSAQIMGNTESIEPFDSCIFKRRVLSGEYVVCNKHLVDDLIKLGLWNKELKDTIIAHNGSIQSIDSIPDDIKALYKTVWEMSMKNLIDLSSERGPFICMTQSLNLFMSAPTIKKLTSMHFYGWKRGLKTGIYYLRSKAQASAAKFSIDASLEKKVKAKEQQTNPDSDAQVQVTAEEILACSLENREACELCSS